MTPSEHAAQALRLLDDLPRTVAWLWLPRLRTIRAHMELAQAGAAANEAALDQIVEGERVAERARVARGWRLRVVAGTEVVR